ncbi:MAG: TonB-dependent receptor plug domain-containing protein [Prevotellaceae bacterium]|jgi:TonB-dependent SusC/RagA subfamily outer membrane receptor|nr:TonB-dependent receptor plug domain-containing protein [Prevotellaceae bacterium]
MKQIIFSTIILLNFAMMNAQNQPFPYEQRWKEIENLQNQGQLKSLLPKVEAIFAQAKKENNTVEIVNSLMLKARIVSQTQDDNGENRYKMVIAEIEKEILAMAGRGVARNAPTENLTTAVLQSLLAGIYDNYAQNTRWQRRDITETQTPSDDIATWTTARLTAKSLDLYRESVSNKNLLQATKTADFKKILTSDQDIDLFPTLFDILNFRYINALKNDYNNNNSKITQNLFDELIDFHKNDRDKSAFLNFQLEKINNDAEKILELAQTFPNEPFAAYLYYKVAEKYRYSDKKRTYDICQNVTFSEKNKWSANCKNLMEYLQQQKLTVKIDKNMLPNEPIAVTLTATNLDTVYYRIYSNIQDKEDSLYLSSKNGKLYKSDIWELRHFDDFIEHSTIIKLDGLPRGVYGIEISNNQDFIEEKEGTPYFANVEYFYVNNWVTIRLDKNSSQLLNRKTGKPIANQKLKLYNDDKEKHFFSTTNKHGIFSLVFKAKDEEGEKENIDYSDDEIYVYDPDSKAYIEINYNYYDDDDDDDLADKEADIFTDRAIYRPGQTIYFKAILYDKNKNKHKSQIAKNQEVIIDLQNANYKTVSSLKLVSNDYGSVFGEFVIPSNGLTGHYLLVDNYAKNRYYFRVEEYKRPKFEVKFDELKGEFTLENEVKATGKAVSFAGAPISDAKVVYRVERQEIFPYYRMIYPPRYSYQETIINGESTTDSEGKFEIKFIAKSKDAAVGALRATPLPKEYRTYNYTVFADITDINGETHSAETRVSIGDLPRKLTLNIPEETLQKDFKNIVISSTNLNGIKEVSQGKIIVTQLISPERIILPNKTNSNNRRDYYYYNEEQNTDYQLYDKETFIKYFPHLPYSADELNPLFWQKGNTQTFDFNTQKSDSVKINTPFSKGIYLVEAFTMYGNDSIKTQKVVRILDDKTLQAINNNFYSVNLEKAAYSVGETIKITFLSDIKNTVAIVHLESGNKWVEHREIPIKNGKGVLEIVAKQEHIADGLFVASYLLWENGYKQENFKINVTEKPKNLKITTKVFRDKLTPGAPETWELVISGEDKDKIAAEVLATMYDASLDQFVPHSFSFKPLDYTRSRYDDERIYENINLREIYRLNNFWLSPYDKYFNYVSPHFPNLISYSNHSDITKALSGEFAGVEVATMAYGSSSSVRIRGLNSVNAGSNPLYVVDGVPIADISDLKPDEISSTTILKDETATALYGSRGANGVILITTNQGQEKEKQLAQIQPRTNLQETAFFYPNLYTDENGDIKLSFTSPEALTRWKLMILAHTQDLHSGTAEFYAQTQKELMIVPNVPRFLREGDEVTISTKINNLSGKDLSGNAQIILTDALSGKIILQGIDCKELTYTKCLELIAGLKNREFSAEAGKNAEVSWQFIVPNTVQALEYKIIAATNDGNFSDGESSVLPVLPNRMLVTETMPIFAKEGQTKTFTFEKLVNLPLTPSKGGGTPTSQNLQNDETAHTPSPAGRVGEGFQNFNLTLEITANPLWIAVMSLPYLREFPYECSEQLFSRLYGNILSTHILNQNPKIKRVFDEWNNVGALRATPLQDNEELKNIILEETPWVRNAQNENEQRKRLALFFDLNKMAQENSQAQEKLIRRQNADGGFAWFEGGKSSPYITEHIVQGFGQLNKMLGENVGALRATPLQDLISKAIKYIDSEQIKEIKRQQENIKKQGGKIDGKQFIHYYYVRSFWKEKYPLPAEATKYLGDINKNITEYFKNYDLQRKAMIAVVLNRYGFQNSAKTVINNLKETSVETDEMGMYWKDNRAGWLWYQSPVEAQAKTIEAFAEVGANAVGAGRALPLQTDIEEMKIWLLKNRQTNAWNSTKATTDAVYALMNFGKDWSNAEEGVKVTVGNGTNLKEKVKKVVEPSNSEKIEQAAGYIKYSWKGTEITPELGTVKIEKTSAGTMWGGMYWQYFENLDKITSASTNVKIEKQIFLKKNTENGQQLFVIAGNDPQSPENSGDSRLRGNDSVIHVGDLVTIRLVIKIDREMEYIHIKDMRAAGFEPTNVLSGYKYQNGAAYYESTRDAATNFFFERMPKGTYVFEYDVRANNAGVFSNGITTLQNMYAPEMSAHSEGVRVVIEK